MKTLNLLSICLFIVSCGIREVPNRNTPTKKVIIDYVYNLRYERFYDVDNDINKIKFSYGNKELTYNIGRFDSIEVLAYNYHKALIRRSQGGIVSYILINQGVGTSLNLTDIRDVEVYKGDFYIISNNKIWRVSSTGLKEVDNLGTYNGNMVQQYGKIFYSKYANGAWFLTSFDGISAKDEVTLSYDEVVEFGKIGDTLIGLYVDTAQYFAFNYDNQNLFELTLNEFQLPIASNGGTILLRDSGLDQELFTMNSSNAYTTSTSAELYYVDIASYSNNLFLAKNEVTDTAGSLYHLNANGDFVETLSSINSDKFSIVIDSVLLNNTSYMILRTEGDSDYLVSFSNGSLNVIRELELGFTLYKENNQLFLKRLLNGFNKIYTLDGSFLRNISRAN